MNLQSRQIQGELMKKDLYGIMKLRYQSNIFGMQDLTMKSKRVNRVQPFELFDNLLTEKVRKCYETIAFDLLVGQPGQTIETMHDTCDKIIKLKPTVVQTSLLAYKPWLNKASIRMVEDGPLPDFMERKDLLDVIDQRLKEAGCPRVVLESYVYQVIT